MNKGDSMSKEISPPEDQEAVDVVEEDHIYGIISLRDFIGAEFQQV